MRGWLTDTMSLTAKLMTHSEQFRVHKLRQERGVCLADECVEIGLPRRIQVQEREVLLECDGKPVVFAHTIVPLSATSHDWPFFGRLGERSLGTTLFGDPRVERGELRYAKLAAHHPLVKRAWRAIGSEENSAMRDVVPLLARRCLYRRRRGVLLVTEVFLPAITRLVPRKINIATSWRSGSRLATLSR
jgi:chorismate--pyruvate lyase